MYSSDAHTNVYKGSIAVWRGVGKSARRGMRGGGEGMFRSRADQWRENMVATGCGIHQRRYSAYLLRSLLSSLRSLFRPPAPFLFFPLSPRSFTCVHDDRGTERGRGLCKKKKKKKLFHWELFAIKKKKKGTRLCRLLSQPNIPRCRRKKNLPPVFTPTFGYLETHYRAPSREHGLRTFLKSSTISRIRARWMYCVA